MCRSFSRSIEIIIVTMEKLCFAVLLLFVIIVGDYFILGQSTTGDCSNDEQDKYYNHALFEAQISRLENRVDSQKVSGNHCPKGFSYSVFGFSKCYAVLDERVNWTTAQQRCMELHNRAQLAIIINIQEVQITSEILRDLSCRQTNRLPDNTARTSNGFWIGARRWNISDCTSPLEWTSNSDTTFPIEYNNWAPYEPNCASNSEACASINKWHNSKWNDLLCAWSACPLCEITIRT